MAAHHKELWRTFRQQILEIDGYRCVRCARSEADDATLQIHHRYYAKGKLPWEYSFNACETLCKRCHAEEHGLIKPSNGWEFICEDDLGDLSGICDHCGTSIRYSFLIFHPKWEPMEVETFCCDDLTGTDLAKHHRKIADRRKRFISSKRWQKDGYGRIKIRVSASQAAIDLQDGSYWIEIEGKRGKKRFDSIDMAKIELFKIANDGSLERYLASIKTKKG